MFPDHRMYRTLREAIDGACRPLYWHLPLLTATFTTFDVAEASCYDPVQKDRLLAIVEAGFGGLDRFNAALTTTMTALKHKALHSLAGGGAVFEATPTETKSRRLAPRLPI